MEEIKANKYIRLENGIILKYGEKQSVKIENNTYTDYSGEYEWSSTVVNHSPNIIDLIEEGDYVNGYKVFKAHLESETYGKYVDIYCPSMNLKLEFVEHIFAKQVKSIVTKEQFEKISYKVEK